MPVKGKIAPVSGRAKHCFECHGNGKKKAGLAVDKYTDEELAIREKKGSGTVVRSTLRAVPATVPDPFFSERS